MIPPNSCQQVHCHCLINLSKQRLGLGLCYLQILQKGVHRYINTGYKMPHTDVLQLRMLTIMRSWTKGCLQNNRHAAGV